MERRTVNGPQAGQRYSYSVTRVTSGEALPRDDALLGNNFLRKY
jgi:hypothetical protein